MSEEDKVIEAVPEVAAADVSAEEVKEDEKVEKGETCQDAGELKEEVKDGVELMDEKVEDTNDVEEVGDENDVEKVGDEKDGPKVEDEQDGEKVEDKKNDEVVHDLKEDDVVEDKKEEKIVEDKESEAQDKDEDKEGVNEGVKPEEEDVGEDKKEKEENIKQDSKKRATKPSGKVSNKDKSKKKGEKDKKEENPKTPAPTVERPQRERKIVVRLVESIEKESTKEFHIEKGRGTALNDIPNVQFKLSRKKWDETFRVLHTILFARRGKATEFKTNIGKFSGFVFHDNEEKQKMKIKEKIDKLVKDKLVEFCNVLDIPVSRTTTRKEDMVTKLMEFLEAPHATTTELLSDKKRKRGGNESESSSKRKAKNRKGSESDSDDESDDPEEAHKDVVNGVAERSDDEMSEQDRSGEEEESGYESEEEKQNKKKETKKTSAKKSMGKVAKKDKKDEGYGDESEEEKETKKKKAKKDPAKTSNSKAKEDKVYGTKASAKRKAEALKEKSSKESSGKKRMKGKEEPKGDKFVPNDDELKNAICDILKEVDFNTATFTDILKLLAKRFEADLTTRKSSIKLMIQDELSKLVDEAEAENEDDNSIQPSKEGVKA